MTEVKEQPKKTRTVPGEHSLYVHVPDELYAKLQETADGRPLNVWLSRLVVRNFDKFGLE
jgi:hypothetical protein